MLETERLLLRVPLADDLLPWRDLLSDARATRFIGGPQDEAGAWRNLCLFVGAWTVQGYSNFSVIEKETGRWVGRAGPWLPPGWPGREVGWAFSPSAWGRGYATEAAARCLDWVFDDLGWDEVVHIIHPGNTASVAVARRLGAELVGVAGDGADLYRTTGQAWRQRGRDKAASTLKPPRSLL
jgi:RimJ/RimL family protein N-acetyltransferase